MQSLFTNPPRDAVWSVVQVQSFCAAAKGMGRPSLALAVKLAYHLGQRECDVLKLSWHDFDGQTISLRQSKTGAAVCIPVLGGLLEILNKTKRKGPLIVVSETTDRPYKENKFRHTFAKIRDAADLKDLRFMDLRRSAVVALAEAGCSTPEISAITGHKLDRTQAILETYLPRNSTMAGNAIAKLADHRAKKLEGSQN